MKLEPSPGYVLKTSTLSGDPVKVFINACSDPQVPEPDTLDPAQIILRIQRNEDWIVPIVVSPRREDVDKAGKHCYVFDCCMNPKVLQLGVVDPGVKILTNETCIELVEDSSGLHLDRQFTMPRMKAKGGLNHTELAPNAFQKGPRPLEEVLADASKPGATLPDRLGGITAGKDPTKKNIAPLITELSGTTSTYQFSKYRGEYSGSGVPPSNAITITGELLKLYQNGSDLEYGNDKIPVGFLPAKIDAIYTKDDSTLHVYIWQ